MKKPRTFIDRFSGPNSAIYVRFVCVCVCIGVSYGNLRTKWLLT